MCSGAARVRCGAIFYTVLISKHKSDLLYIFWMCARERRTEHNGSGAQKSVVVSPGSDTTRVYVVARRTSHVSTKLRAVANLASRLMASDVGFCSMCIAYMYNRIKSSNIFAGGLCGIFMPLSCCQYLPVRLRSFNTYYCYCIVVVVALQRRN